MPLGGAQTGAEPSSYQAAPPHHADDFLRRRCVADREARHSEDACQEPKHRPGWLAQLRTTVRTWRPFIVGNETDHDVSLASLGVI
jgi:hypothetical protein